MSLYGLFMSGSMLSAITFEADIRFAVMDFTPTYPRQKENIIELNKKSRIAKRRWKQPLRRWPGRLY